ncbi:putative lactoylglutathione lyase (Glo1) [Aspergillus ibericus CBS 121593]|uniref:Putative lactoylglutathione lyase n=1 Tax=Aspergillus ibericus CBS 121593 TaxID=1448316 RepID=A0A395GLK7_9EURO|nr:putative lactoylglutathione lyase [Aspergillus ibericus CBS 121593]RAK96391.1 putative lactoylglutathione lyase [Aspergillus ibericus CBS 121593]
MSESSNTFEPGLYLPGGHNTDPPLPLSSPTTNYRLNHVMLRTRDPKRTLHFYLDLMGMRTVFTMNTGPFTIYYLGYPATADDRANLPAWAARIADIPVLTQTLGLLEFYHVHGMENPDNGFKVSTGNDPPNLGLGHLGFTVPDVSDALERLRSEGVRVFKELGDVSRESVPLSHWEESRGIGKGQVHERFAEIYGQVAVVLDPDGYMVELVPQDMVF